MVINVSIAKKRINIKKKLIRSVVFLLFEVMISEKTKPQIPIFKLVNNKKVSPTISLLRLLIIKRMANITIENNPKMV